MIKKTPLNKPKAEVNTRKSIKNTRDGYHLNSSYWQNYKKTLPPLSPFLFEIAVGMLLGDAGAHHVSNHAYIKFEQCVDQKEFLLNQFELFKVYCFMEEPAPRYDKNESNGQVYEKSYWFKTFSFPCFTKLYKLFYESNNNKKAPRHVKIINPGIVTQYVTPLSLAYWIMCDGSLDGNTLIMHSQSFTETENIILSNELNSKFGFHTQVIPHKQHYFVIKFPSQDALLLRDLIKPFIIPSMLYKVPK